MSSSSKVDNGSFPDKVGQRAGLGGRVLEGFAGEGRIWRACWSGDHVTDGATMDIDRAKAERAAVQRPRWAVYQGDTRKALEAGWMAHRPWDVVDLDCYGSPWAFLRALLQPGREWPERCTVLLTDGYYSQRGLASPCKALFGDAATLRTDTPSEFYHEAVDARIAEWCGAAGVQAVDRSWILTRKRLLLHTLIVES